MYEENGVPSSLLGGAWAFPYTIQSPMYDLTNGIVSATKTLLAPSVLSGGYIFSTRNFLALEIFKQSTKKAVANSKAR